MRSSTVIQNLALGILIILLTVSTGQGSPLLKEDFSDITDTITGKAAAAELDHSIMPAWGGIFPVKSGEKFKGRGSNF